MMNIDFIVKIILAGKNKMSSRVDKRCGRRGYGIDFQGFLG